MEEYKNDKVNQKDVDLICHVFGERAYNLPYLASVMNRLDPKYFKPLLGRESICVGKFKKFSVHDIVTACWPWLDKTTRETVLASDKGKRFPEYLTVDVGREYSFENAVKCGVLSDKNKCPTKCLTGIYKLNAIRTSGYVRRDWFAYLVYNCHKLDSASREKLGRVFLRTDTFESYFKNLEIQHYDYWLHFPILLTLSEILTSAAAIFFTPYVLPLLIANCFTSRFLARAIASGDLGKRIKGIFKRDPLNRFYKKDEVTYRSNTCIICNKNGRQQVFVPRFF